jgi:hypothetical protein
MEQILIKMQTFKLFTEEHMVITILENKKKENMNGT